MFFENDEGIRLEMVGGWPSGYKDVGAEYHIRAPTGGENLEFPGKRSLTVLARKYLGSPYQESYRYGDILNFCISGGVSKEKRAAFFGAIAARTVEKK